MGPRLKKLALPAPDAVLKKMAVSEHHCVTTLLISWISTPETSTGYWHLDFFKILVAIFLSASLFLFLSFTSVGRYHQ